MRNTAIGKAAVTNQRSILNRLICKLTVTENKLSDACNVHGNAAEKIVVAA